MPSLSQFELSNALRIAKMPDGLVRAVISTNDVDADLYLQGAHLTHWKPRGQRPVLFVSPASLFAPGKAIRGGVPIIFPWFGPRGEGKPGPPHGFARTTEWALETTRLHTDGSVEITLVLPPDRTTQLFPDFHLRFRVTLGAELKMELETRNVGTEPFTYEEALHTYFSISDVQLVSISGLEGTTYIDKTDRFKRKQLGNEPIRIAKETDQVHVDTKTTCVIDDPLWKRRIVIEKSGSESTVVWNPWMEKTRAMSDMTADSWKGMVCVESANAGENAITLLPGASHRLMVVVRVEPS